MNGGTVIALGSNLGDRLENLRSGLRAIERVAIPGTGVLASRVYRSAPVDCPPGSGDFLNAAIAFHSALGVRELLLALQAVEAALGRAAQREVNAPRPLDLDIIVFGDVVLQEPMLTLPHPRATERRFVLAPMADVVPDLMWPGAGMSVQELLDRLPPDPSLNPICELSSP